MALVRWSNDPLNFIQLNFFLLKNPEEDFSLSFVSLYMKDCDDRLEGWDSQRTEKASITLTPAKVEVQAGTLQQEKEMIGKAGLCHLCRLISR